jgi:hypothetical protein
LLLIRDDVLRLSGHEGFDVIDQLIRQNPHGLLGVTMKFGKRPEFDRLLRDAAQRKFDMVMAWSVDGLAAVCRIWSVS